MTAGTNLMLPDDQIRQSYNQLVAEINKQMETKLDHFFRDKLQCGPGCTECCIRFSVLAIEAAMISAALKKSDSGGDRDEKYCALLREGLCSIYADRPLICRTQGLPIGYIDEGEGTIQVSACHLNFDESYAFEYDELLLMDQFNSILAELNEKYCEAAGLDPRQRISLAALAG